MKRLIGNLTVLFSAVLLLPGLGCDSEFQGTSSGEYSQESFLMKPVVLLEADHVGQLVDPAILALGPPEGAGEVASYFLSLNQHLRTAIDTGINPDDILPAWEDPAGRPMKRAPRDGPPIMVLPTLPIIDIVENNRTFPPGIDKDDFYLAPVPFAPVVAVMSRFHGHWFLCTGSLVGPSQVLTAGHCLFDPIHEIYADRVLVFAPGFGVSELDRVDGSTGFDIMDEWLDLADPEFDLAVLRTEKDMGYELGWFGFFEATEALQDLELETAGFSQLIRDGHQIQTIQQGHLVNDAPRIMDMRKNTVQFVADQIIGSTGAPLWTLAPEGRSIVAVHNGLDEGDAVAVMLTAEKLEWVRSLVPGSLPEPRPPF